MNCFGKSRNGSSAATSDAERRFRLPAERRRGKGAVERERGKSAPPSSASPSPTDDDDDDDDLGGRRRGLGFLEDIEIRRRLLDASDDAVVCVRLLGRGRSVI